MMVQCPLVYPTMVQLRQFASRAETRCVNLLAIRTTSQLCARYDQRDQTKKGGSNNDQEEPCSSDGRRNRICGMLGARECAAVELRGDGRTDLFACRRNATAGWHPSGQLFVATRGTSGSTPHRSRLRTKRCLGGRGRLLRKY